MPIFHNYNKPIIVVNNAGCKSQAKIAFWFYIYINMEKKYDTYNVEMSSTAPGKLHYVVHVLTAIFALWIAGSVPILAAADTEGHQGHCHTWLGTTNINVYNIKPRDFLRIPTDMCNNSPRHKWKHRESYCTLFTRRALYPACMPHWWVWPGICVYSQVID